MRFRASVTGLKPQLHISNVPTDCLCTAGNRLEHASDWVSGTPQIKVNGHIMKLNLDFLMSK